MAESGASGKKPRIRKTAPTVRERVEAAQQQAQKPPKAKKLRLPKKTFRLNIPKNPFFDLLRSIGRKVVKVLSWFLPRYFLNSWREVRQVTWTTRRETWRLTLAVFIFAIIFGAMVAGVDKGLDEIFRKVVLK